MYLPANYQFACPMKTNSGKKALETLPIELDALDARRPLVLTTAAIARAGELKHVINAFKSSGVTIGVFDEIPARAELSIVERLAEIYNEKNRDALIAVGGGAVMDTAKAVNILVSGNARELSYYAKTRKLKKALRPLAYVPVGKAEGYETTQMANVGEMRFTAPFLMPDLATIDHRMLRAVNPDILATALIALTQAVEAAASPAKNPLTDAYAHVAISLIKENLKPVLRTPRNLQGRLALANAAVMAGCAFANAPLGAAFQIGSAAASLGASGAGIYMALLLPFVLEGIVMQGDHARLENLLIPLAGQDLYAATAPDQLAREAVKALRAFMADLAGAPGVTLPLNLKDACLARDVLKEIASAAAKGLKGLKTAEAQRLLEQAWEGQAG